MGREMVPKTRHESFIKLTASTGLKCVEVRLIKANKKCIVLLQMMVDPHRTLVGEPLQGRRHDIGLPLSRQVRQGQLFQEYHRGSIQALRWNSVTGEGAALAGVIRLKGIIDRRSEE